MFILASMFAIQFFYITFPFLRMNDSGERKINKDNSIEKNFELFGVWGDILSKAELQ